METLETITRQLLNSTVGTVGRVNAKDLPSVELKTFSDTDIHFGSITVDFMSKPASLSMDCYITTGGPLLRAIHIDVDDEADCSWRRLLLEIEAIQLQVKLRSAIRVLSSDFRDELKGYISYTEGLSPEDKLYLEVNPSKIIASFPLSIAKRELESVELALNHPNDSNK